MPNGVAIPVAFMRCYVALHHHTTLRQHEFSRQVIVPHFRHYLSVTIVRVNSIGVVKVSRVWGQVFTREILQQSHRPKMFFDGLIKLESHFLVNRATELLISEMVQGRPADNHTI